MKIRGLAPWFGAKRMLAERIIKEFGLHQAYWEPFCGSMAVLLAKPPTGTETVNDLHGDLINLARVIASDRWRELAERARRTLCHELIGREAIKAVRRPGPVANAIDSIDDKHVSRAYLYFVASWMGRSGLSGIKPERAGSTPSRRFTTKGGSPATRLTSATDSIAAFHERLKKVNILRMDSFELLKKIQDDPRTVIYCDPPYLAKSATYIHDFKMEDHVRLASSLSRFKKAKCS